MIELPVPTADPAQAGQDLSRAGYCVLTGALTDDVRDQMRTRVREQAVGERALGVGVDDTKPGGRYMGGAGRADKSNRRVWNLLNKGQVFQRLLTQPDVNTLVGQIVGDDFLLSGIQANFVSPGDDPLPIHSDQGYVPRPWPPYAMTASVIWMLDEFTEHNGATTVVPGSHVERPSIEAAETLARARLIRRGGIPVCGPAGSALVFDGRIVHGTGFNSTGEQRLGALTYFCRPFLRQQENFFLSIRPEVLANLPGEVKARLGYQVWKTLGSVEGVCAEESFVDRPVHVLGELDPGGGAPDRLDVHVAAGPAA
jgi:ectoine hydroxylase-related dioxygenase (phytanoyl-CoA dioxygenase family)